MVLACTSIAVSMNTVAEGNDSGWDASESDLSPELYSQSSGSCDSLDGSLELNPISFCSSTGFDLSPAAVESFHWSRRRSAQPPTVPGLSSEYPDDFQFTTVTPICYRMNYDTDSDTMRAVDDRQSKGSHVYHHSGDYGLLGGDSHDVRNPGSRQKNRPTTRRSGRLAPDSRAFGEVGRTNVSNNDNDWEWQGGGGLGGVGRGGAGGAGRMEWGATDSDCGGGRRIEAVVMPCCDEPQQNYYFEQNRFPPGCLDIVLNGNDRGCESDASSDLCRGSKDVTAQCFRSTTSGYVTADQRSRSWSSLNSFDGCDGLDEVVTTCAADPGDCFEDEQLRRDGVSLVPVSVSMESLSSSDDVDARCAEGYLCIDTTLRNCNVDDDDAMVDMTISPARDLSSSSRCGPAENCNDDDQYEVGLINNYICCSGCGRRRDEEADWRLQQQSYADTHDVTGRGFGWEYTSGKTVESNDGGRGIMERERDRCWNFDETFDERRASWPPGCASAATDRRCRGSHDARSGHRKSNCRSPDRRQRKRHRKSGAHVGHRRASRKSSALGSSRARETSYAASRSRTTKGSGADQVSRNRSVARHRQTAPHSSNLPRTVSQGTETSGSGGGQTATSRMTSISSVAKGSRSKQTEIRNGPTPTNDFHHSDVIESTKTANKSQHRNVITPVSKATSAPASLGAYNKSSTRRAVRVEKLPLKGPDNRTVFHASREAVMRNGQAPTTPEPMADQPMAQAEANYQQPDLVVMTTIIQSKPSLYGPVSGECLAGGELFGKPFRRIPVFYSIRAIVSYEEDHGLHRNRTTSTVHRRLSNARTKYQNPESVDRVQLVPCIESSTADVPRLIEGTSAPMNLASIAYLDAVVDGGESLVRLPSVEKQFAPISSQFDVGCVDSVSVSPRVLQSTSDQLGQTSDASVPRKQSVSFADMHPGHNGLTSIYPLQCAQDELCLQPSTLIPDRPLLSDDDLLIPSELLARVAAASDRDFMRPSLVPRPKSDAIGTSVTQVVSRWRKHYMDNDPCYPEQDPQNTWVRSVNSKSIQFNDDIAYCPAAQLKNCRSVETNKIIYYETTAAAPASNPTYIDPTYVDPTYVNPTYVGPTYVDPTYVDPTSSRLSGCNCVACNGDDFDDSRLPYRRSSDSVSTVSSSFCSSGRPQRLASSSSIGGGGGGSRRRRLAGVPSRSSVDAAVLDMLSSSLSIRCDEGDGNVSSNHLPTAGDPFDNGSGSRTTESFDDEKFHVESLLASIRSTARQFMTDIIARKAALRLEQQQQQQQQLRHLQQLQQCQQQQQFKLQQPQQQQRQEVQRRQQHQQLQQQQLQQLQRLQKQQQGQLKIQEQPQHQKQELEAEFQDFQQRQEQPLKEEFQLQLLQKQMQQQRQQFKQSLPPQQTDLSESMLTDYS